jgi:hypothetical protein
MPVMTMPPERASSATPEARYGFFALQVRAVPGWAPGAAIGGVIENLATGEKQRFESTTELGELLAAWSRSLSVNHQ